MRTVCVRVPETHHIAAAKQADPSVPSYGSRERGVLLSARDRRLDRLFVRFPSFPIQYRSGCQWPFVVSHSNKRRSDDGPALKWWPRGAPARLNFNFFLFQPLAAAAAAGTCCYLVRALGSDYIH
jgi:hypothetical protein